MIVWCGDPEQHDAHGACPGHAAPEVEPTDEQWLGLLRGMPDEEALPRIRYVRDSLSMGHRCFMMNHDARIEQLEHALAEARARAEDSPDSSQ